MEKLGRIKKAIMLMISFSFSYIMGTAYANMEIEEDRSNTIPESNPTDPRDAMALSEFLNSGAVEDETPPPVTSSPPVTPPVTPNPSYDPTYLPTYLPSYNPTE